MKLQYCHKLPVKVSLSSFKYCYMQESEEHKIYVHRHLAREGSFFFHIRHSLVALFLESVL